MEIDNKTLLNCVDELIRDLDIRRKNIKTNYEVVGQEEEQAKDYKTGNLLWEDDECTIPKHRAIWDHVQKTHLTDEEKRQIYTIDKLEKELMKLVGKVAG